jgi:Ca2+-binding RTX toxin-like protein
METKMPNTVLSSTSATLADGESNLVLTEASGTETFENFVTGPIADGENGWKHAGSHDQEIVSLLGDNWFRMSSDPTSGDFGGPYSPALAAAAGETVTGATYQNQTIAFTFKAVNPIADNSRLEVDVGNDAGTDRNNFLVIESIAGQGLRIAVNEPLTDGNWANNSFTGFTGNRELISGVDPSVEHTLEMRLAYVDGSDNDVIGIYLDGVQIGTTTTFENYREFHLALDHDTEATANVTSRLFFRAGAGGVAPQDGPGGLNQGFYFDDITNTTFNHANATGNSGNNILIGNSGDNVLTGLAGNDVLDGGEGTDTAVYSGSFGAYRVSTTSVLDVGLGSPDGSDTLANIETFQFADVTVTDATFFMGSSGKNKFTGGSGTDAMNGFNGSDRLYGNDGDDVLFGGNGSDRLEGGTGTDILDGGRNRDVMLGGTGADTFFYSDALNSKAGSTRDFIRDFEVGVDQIDVSALGLTFIADAAFSGTAGELHFRIVDKAGTANDHTYVEADIDGNGKADFQIDLFGVHTLTAGDFNL